jgi:hypothetical protein
MGRASRKKKEKRESWMRRPDYVPVRFECMEMREANARCGPFKSKRATMSECPTCEWKVVLHCSGCKIQISGCFCTAAERMTEDELKQFHQQVMEKKAKNAGLIIPSNLHLN